MKHRSTSRKKKIKNQFQPPPIETKNKFKNTEQMEI